MVTQKHYRRGKTMEPNSLLPSLRDIHLPSPISSWPLTVGWYILAALLLFIIIGAVSLLVRYIQKNRVKRAAIKHLTKLQAHYQQQQATIPTLQEISSILRRVALAYYPRHHVAGLHGLDWLRFLNETGNTTSFTEEAQILLSGPYRRHVTTDLNQLFSISIQWIKIIK